MFRADQSDAIIQEIAGRVGKAPRRFSLLRWFRGRIKPPQWLTPDDLVSRIYAEQDRILRDGDVRWAVVVQANTRLFQPGTSITGAQVIYAPHRDVPLEGLKRLAGRLFALKGTTPTDPALRKIANMLTDERERALDWEIPMTLTEGRRIVTTIVMPSRVHMPGGYLGASEFPVLVHPQTLFAMFVPSRYWPRELIDQWKVSTKGSAAEPGAKPVIELTPTAAEEIHEIVRNQDDLGENWWLRIGVKRGSNGVFSYILDLTDTAPGAKDSVDECHRINIIVDETSRPYITGTVVDFRRTPEGTGFVFNNPNAG